MGELDWLAAQFEANRSHLRGVAYRMLGSASEAEDAVQETWLKLSRSDAASIDNFGGWLTTAVARVCLDILRTRTARRENPIDELLSDSIASTGTESDPEREVLLADSVGLALLVVMETLAPAERLAFVLHDMFAVPFAEIAPIVGRSTAAARQLASRARRQVQGANTSAADHGAHREIVDAFLAASREGEFDALLAMLDPDVTLRADRPATAAGVIETTGARAVAATFSGRARFAQTAIIDGRPGAVWAPNGQPRVAFSFAIADEKIVAIDILADPQILGRIEFNP